MKFQLLGGSHTENGVTISADPNKDTFVFSDTDLEKEYPTRFRRTFEDTRSPEKRSIRTVIPEVQVAPILVQETASTPEPEQVAPEVLEEPKKPEKKVRGPAKKVPTRRRGG